MVRSILLGVLCSITAILPTSIATPVTSYPYTSSRSVVARNESASSGSFISNTSSPSYPNPETCKGNCTWSHDPSIIESGGTYYRFTTSGNIAITTAPSLEGPWTYQGAVLTNGTSIALNDRQDIWAPNVVKFGNTYYCYYSVSFLGTQESLIGVATSKSLKPGTWTDYGNFNIPKSSAYNLIDPAVIQETPDSPIYFTWGSFWDGIFQAKITEDQLLDFTAGVKKSNTTSAINSNANTTTPTRYLPSITNIARNGSTGADVVEGATIYKSSENNKYYLFFSAGNCCAVPPNLPEPGHEYRAMVCRSDSVEGPFVDKEGRACLGEDGSFGGTTVLSSHGDVFAPGGGGVLDYGGRTVMYYHYVKPSLGFDATQFQFGFNYLEFQNGWPVAVSKY
ncbi:endo-1,5-alpha-L-arabinosidase [Massarina eburnea CBS 473.64]|uniref:Arabinan endo-1,5-alpha-L-arabinosidase n=1 Tax=Massarina eburnea CBS 473.64 TaxID=1395130 RepID=A0A6A6RVR4_9PLEO|nr:endo-1,5-alpha-L-arabinosidase [Massarina eburnea CBS 473.64]